MCKFSTMPDDPDKQTQTQRLFTVYPTCCHRPKSLLSNERNSDEGPHRRELSPRALLRYYTTRKNHFLCQQIYIACEWQKSSALTAWHSFHGGVRGKDNEQEAYHSPVQERTTNPNHLTCNIWCSKCFSSATAKPVTELILL